MYISGEKVVVLEPISIHPEAVQRGWIWRCLGLYKGLQGHHLGEWIMVVDHALRRLMLEHIAELALGCEHCHFVCAIGLVWTYTVVGTPKPQHNRNRDDDPVVCSYCSSSSARARRRMRSCLQ